MSEQQFELLQDDTAELQQLLDTHRQLRPDECADFLVRWPATLQSLCEVLRVTLEMEQVNNAKHVSEAMVIALSSYLGGRDLYMPKGASLKTALRDIRIWRDFKGDNLEQLAREYDLTERRISEIVAEQRAAFVARKQRRLF